MRSYNVDQYRVVQSTVDDLKPVGIGGHGDMPPSMLMAKFEETAGDAYDDNGYDNYARGLLTDWGPDTNKFEHEEARGSMNRSTGRLQLLHNGHRGDVETPYRAEHFDGFMGPEDRDPRGINTDPDTKHLVEQASARTRFIRFTADGNDQVTGGGRSEGQLMADQQKMYRRMRNQLVIFDRQLDGRREGMRRQWAHASSIPKALTTQSYGDLIKDHALTPQHRARVICGKILRDTNWYRRGTIDTDLHTALYGGARRQRRTRGDASTVSTADGDAEYTESDNTIAFKAAGILLANICAGRERAKRIAITGMDADLATARDISVRKTAPFVRDLSSIISAVKLDQTFASADTTIMGRTPGVVDAGSAVSKWSADNTAPAHHWMAAELIYRSVKPGADTRKIAIHVDTMNQFAASDITSGGKTAKYRMQTGMKTPYSSDGDLAVSRATYNYKTGKTVNGDRRLRLVDRGMVSGESDNTLIGKTQKVNYRAATAADVRHDGKFSNNDHQDRHIGKLGSKYTNGLVQDHDDTLSEW